MNETVKALTREEAAQQISDHITAFLEGGPDREAEDIELGQGIGLKVEGISGRWDDAREYLLNNPPASKAAPLTEKQRKSPRL
jgi:hypothetical protein